MHPRAPTLWLILVALGCVACTPQAPHSLVGHYAMRVTARDGPPFRLIIGEWEHEYRADGHLLIHQVGGWKMEQLYRLDGDILTVIDVGGTGSCRLLGIDTGSARYRVHFTGSGIRLDPLRDECAGRRIGMTVHAWERIR
jgi:hypothetical protein